MKLRRLSFSAEFLQWFGLGGAALVWASQHVLGFGTTVARCGAGGVKFGIDLHTWELTTFLVALGLAAAAEAAAAVTVWRTWGTNVDGPPPDSRRHFFALGALAGNLLFMVIILLSGISTLVLDPCRQA